MKEGRLNSMNLAQHDACQRIHRARWVDGPYTARVKVPGEPVRHHAREEENRVFPQVADGEFALARRGSSRRVARGGCVTKRGRLARCLRFI